MLFLTVIVSCLIFTNIPLSFNLFLFDTENEAVLKADTVLFDDSKEFVLITLILLDIILALITIRKYLSVKIVKLNDHVVSGTRGPPLKACSLI
jgi:hypothetical protein